MIGGAFRFYSVLGTHLSCITCRVADTVVLTHALPSTTLEMEMGTRQEVLEKPTSKADHLRMLQDLNGNVCEVVTGMTLGERVRFLERPGSNGIQP